MTVALYIASVLGAIALYLMMPKRGYTPVRLGMLLGAAVMGGLWLYLAKYLPAMTGLPSAAMGYYYLFSFIAVGAAARVITHTKPVYSAWWFVLVVLASSGLFLTLSAEFMAFAMIIIYGGAILVTYVFVIMLASDPGNAASTTGGAEYDRLPREAGVAVTVGFVLLALLLGVFASHSEGDAVYPQNPQAAAVRDIQVVATALPGRAISVLAEKSTGEIPATAGQIRQLENVERVGLDLFENHPLGLELAGVILLLSLIGAVVIAYRRVEGADV